ncbi:MAG: UDP-N-acetylmuramoyl-tripeptide--D-alanyl-D-alanine ligase [Planctomycetota bacterium]
MNASVTEIVEVLGGRLLGTAEENASMHADRFVGGVSIDTRSLRRGNAFFALRGDRTDGHAFLADAHDAGASVAIVDTIDAISDAARSLPRLPLVCVPDARLALAQLATHHRERLRDRGIRVAAITGSNGKTTTVRILHAMLHAHGPSHCPPRSFNNDLGLPLTLLNAPPDTATHVCECGINAPGEMRVLADIVKPDVALITSIGRAHLEALGTTDDVAREKAELLRGAPIGIVPGGVPELDRVLSTEGAPLPNKLLRVGTSRADDVVISRIDVDGPEHVGLTLDRTGFDVPLGGMHNALNAAIAITAARAMAPRISDNALRAGLSRVEAPPMRQTRRTLRLSPEGGEIRLINDAYNANPESVEVALAALAGEPRAGAGRRIAVLGDMLELGDHAPEAHRDLGSRLAQSNDVDVVVLLGPLMAFCAGELRRSWDAGRIVPFPELDDRSILQVVSLLRDGDIVLLKGSRGMRLERIASALLDREESSVQTTTSYSEGAP